MYQMSNMHIWLFRETQTFSFNLSLLELEMISQLFTPHFMFSIFEYRQSIEQYKTGPSEN